MSSNYPPPGTTPPVVPAWVTALSGLAPFAAVIPNPIAAAAAGILLQYGPAVYAEFVKLLNNPNPTEQDWLALLQKASQKTYDQYLEEAKAAAGKS